MPYNAKRLSIFFIVAIILLPFIQYANAWTIGTSNAYSTFQPIAVNSPCVITNNYTITCTGIGSAGVSLLNGLSGNVVIQSANSNILVSISGQNIILTSNVMGGSGTSYTFNPPLLNTANAISLVFGTGLGLNGAGYLINTGVTSLNGLTNDVIIKSANSNILVTTSGQNVILTANILTGTSGTTYTFNSPLSSNSANVVSFNFNTIPGFSVIGTLFSQSQASSTSNGFLSSADWQTFNSKLSSQTYGVNSLNTLLGALTIKSANSNILVTTSGQNIILTANVQTGGGQFIRVNSINLLQNDVILKSADSNILVSTSGQNIILTSNVMKGPTYTSTPPITISPTNAIGLSIDNKTIKVNTANQLYAVTGGGQTIYYFSNTVSNVTGYNSMFTTPFSPKKTITSPTIVGGTNTLIGNWISPPLGVSALPAGTYTCHTHADQNTGTKNIQLYCVIREVSPTGTLISVIGTTELSPILISTETESEEDYVTSNVYTLTNPSDRVEVQVWANISGTGGVTNKADLYYGGEADSHLAIPANGGGGGGSTSPSLPYNSIQYNNGGSFGGTTAASWNPATNTLESKNLIADVGITTDNMTDTDGSTAVNYVPFGSLANPDVSQYTYGDINGAYIQVNDTDNPLYTSLQTITISAPGGILFSTVVTPVLQTDTIEGQTSQYQYSTYDEGSGNLEQGDAQYTPGVCGSVSSMGCVVTNINQTGHALDLWNAHLASASPAGFTTPSISSCGSGSPSVSGTDTKGVITVGGGVVSTCKINFGRAYTTVPVCTVSSNSLTSPDAISAIATGSLTIATSATFSGEKLYYICIQ